MVKPGRREGERLDFRGLGRLGWGLRRKAGIRFLDKDSEGGIGVRLGLLNRPAKAEQAIVPF